MTEKRQVIDVDSTCKFQLLADNSTKFSELRDEGGRSVSLFPFILQDIFYALFQDAPPKPLPLDRISTGARLNRLIIEQLTKSREFKRARSFTRGSIVASGMVAMYYGEAVLGNLDKGIADTANEISYVEEELHEAVLQKKAAEKVASVAAGESRPDIAELYEAAVKQWELTAGEQRKKLRTLATRLNLLWNTSGKKNTAISGADVKGEKEGRFATGVEGLGDNKGVWTRGDLGPHLKLVETYLNSPKLQRLAQKVGRLKEIKEQRQGRAVLEEATEVRGIDYGDDLTMVVPEEWAGYFDPVKRPYFKKRYADEALCLYDMKGKRRKGKGSLIICLDNSGSMQGPKEETSKAIAIALMEIAIGQKRDFIVIMFGGPEDEMKVFEVPQGRCTFEQLVEIGEHFLCSAGTDFEKPLQEAVRFLEKDKYPGGDIVFITDGVCKVSPEFLEGYHLRKKTKQFRAIGVLVNYGHVSTAPMEAFCDELLMSKDLKGVDIAGELFGKIRRGT